MSTINITEQVAELKGLIISYKEDNLYSVSWKLIRELVDSLTTIGVIERKIDGIVHGAEQRTRKK